MQIIIHIPAVDALPPAWRDETGAPAVGLFVVEGNEALAVLLDTAPELPPGAVVIGRVVNLAGEPSPRIDPAHQGIFDRLWPRTPVTVAGQTITPPPLWGCYGLPDPEPSLEALRALKRAEIAAASAAALEALRQPYPDFERETWATQAAEARALGAWVATPYETRGPAPDTPTLDAIAAAWGITPAALAARVETKATAYRAAVATAIGRRQSLDDQITTATSPDALAAVVW